MFTKKKAWFVILVSLLCAYLTDAMLHHGFSGIIIFTLNILFVLLGFYLWQEKKNYFVLPWLFLTLTLSVWLFIRDSSWLYFFNFVTPVALAILFIANSRHDSYRKFSYSLLLPFSLFFNLLGKIGVPLKSALAYTDSKATRIIKNILLALPIILFIALLLWSADLVWQKYITDFTHWLHIDTWEFSKVWHILIILYFFFFCGLFSSIIYQTFKPLSISLSEKHEAKNILRLIAMGIIMILAIFIATQIHFLFADASVVEALGIGYQTYAHQGFYQLMIVAIISFFAIWFLTKERTEGCKDLVISYVLIAETILLLISSMQRLWLFVHALAWAPKRFFAWEGMIFFIVLLIIFCIHLAYKKFDRSLFVYIFTILFALNILVINIINPDKFIARQNTDKYIKGQAEEYEMDFDYTAYVSADAIQEGLELFDNARTDNEKRRANLGLNEAWFQLEYYHKQQLLHPYLYHYSKNQAYQLLEPRMPEINKINGAIWNQ